MLPDQTLVNDDEFLNELDSEAKKLIEKENQRFKIAQEAISVEV